MDEPRITAIEYDEAACSVREVQDLKTCTTNGHGGVVWINVDGIHEAAAIEEIGRQFKLHPLVLEDVMNAGQRPKVEEYDDCVFIVIKTLDWDNAQERIMIEQVSIVLGKGFVLTFQERAGDVFDGVRDRIKNNKGKIRRVGADYLTYALLDAVVDHYFLAVEKMDELIDDVEATLTDNPARVDATELHLLKREVLVLRKTLWPAREVVGTLSRADVGDLIAPATEVYLRDVYDHVLQVSETIDVMRDILAAMVDVYHSALSTRMNEVMKVLTIISTIFIPLTFIAGVYGMNFENMPELKWHYGYFASLGVMTGVAVGMFVYVKRQKWL